MKIDWNLVKTGLVTYLQRYAEEHQHPMTKLTHLFGIPMIVASLPVAVVSPLLGAGLFVGGWALQLVGHYVFEKNSPAFFGGPVYLLVGPVWVMLEILQMLGVPLPADLSATPSDAPHAVAPDFSTQN
jgi:uncharacterized membrane protein YGL010W